MGDNQPRRDGPPMFVPGGEELRDTGRESSPRVESRSGSSALERPLPPSQWALPNSDERVSDVRATTQLPIDVAVTTHAAPPPTVDNTYQDAAPSSAPSWDPPIARTNPVTSFDPGIRLRKAIPKNVAIIFAAVQLAVVACLSFIVFQFLQLMGELGDDSGGELVILFAFSGAAVVTAIMHVKPRPNRLAAALCGMAGAADLFLGFRYRELLGFVDFATDITESSSAVVVQIAWLTPLVGIGFLLLAGYHLFRSLQ